MLDGICTTIKFRFIKADFLSTDELVDYLEKNSISMADIVGTFQEEIFKSYGTPVYKYILIYQKKEEKHETA